MANYADDDEISAKWFGGETIPHSNTINKRRHDFICVLAQRLTNRAAGKTEDQTDVGGLLKDAFLDFYGKELKGQKLILNEKLLYDINEQWKGVGFVGILKTDAYLYRR